MFIVVLENEVWDIFNNKYEMEDNLSWLEEEEDIHVEEWKPNAGGWKLVTKCNYAVHDGKVYKYE